MHADLMATLGVGLNLVGVSPKAQLPPVDLNMPAFMVETLAEGTGLAVAAGDRVTVHFIVRTAEGKELANSHKRGMPFTLDLADAESFWLAAIEGMKTDGRRMVRANSSQFPGKGGLTPIVPGDTWIEAELMVLKVQKATSARKHDSGAKSGQR